LGHASEDDVIDLSGRQFGASDELLDDVRAKMVRAHIRQAAAEAADRGSRGCDDDD
jgi:hypothetical protein